MGSAGLSTWTSESLEAEPGDPRSFRKVGDSRGASLQREVENS